MIEDKMRVYLFLIVAIPFMSNISPPYYEKKLLYYFGVK